MYPYLVFVLLISLSLSGCRTISDRHISYDQQGDQRVIIDDAAGAKLSSVDNVEDETEANRLLALNQGYSSQQETERLSAAITQAILKHQLELIEQRAAGTHVADFSSPVECEPGLVVNDSRSERIFWFRRDDNASPWQGVRVLPGESVRIKVAASSTYVVKVEGRDGEMCLRVDGQQGTQIRLLVPAIPNKIDGVDWYFYFRIIA
jgi:hypothetical protein